MRSNRKIISVSLLLAVCWQVIDCTAAQARHGRHHRDYHRFGVSPHGFSYGFYGRGFGIEVGPSYGYPYRPYDYFEPPRYYGPTYYRPYYSDTHPAPAVNFQTVAAELVIQANAKAAPYQLPAEEAFREHRYAEAARFANHAVIEDGGNGKLHLFVSQALFAVGDYRGAAAAMGQGMSLLDRKDWGFVVENYTKFYNNADYVK